MVVNFNIACAVGIAGNGREHGSVSSNNDRKLRGLGGGQATPAAKARFYFFFRHEGERKLLLASR